MLVYQRVVKYLLRWFYLVRIHQMFLQSIPVPVHMPRKYCCFLCASMALGPGKPASCHVGVAHGPMVGGSPRGWYWHSSSPMCTHNSANMPGVGAVLPFDGKTLSRHFIHCRKVRDRWDLPGNKFREWFLVGSSGYGLIHASNMV